MQMTLRWYGSKYDTVTLKQIRQIPGVTGVISTLYGTTPGEAWEMEDILALKKAAATMLPMKPMVVTIFGVMPTFIMPLIRGLMMT